MDWWTAILGRGWCWCKDSTTYGYTVGSGKAYQQVIKLDWFCLYFLVVDVDWCVIHPRGCYGIVVWEWLYGICMGGTSSYGISRVETSLIVESRSIINIPWFMRVWIKSFKTSHLCGSFEQYSQVRPHTENASLLNRTFLISKSGVFKSLTEVITFLPMSNSTMFTFFLPRGGIGLLFTLGSLGPSLISFESIRSWTLYFNVLQFSIEFPRAPKWNSQRAFTSYLGGRTASGGVLTLSIIQAILLEYTVKYGYMALVLGHTSSHVSLIFVVAVDIIVVDVVVADDNVVDFVVVVDVDDTVVIVMVIEWE